MFPVFNADSDGIGVAFCGLEWFWVEQNKIIELGSSFVNNGTRAGVMGDRVTCCVISKAQSLFEDITLLFQLRKNLAQRPSYPLLTELPATEQLRWFY